MAVVACEEPKEIGLAPTNEVGVLYTDTLTITRTTVQLDSVRSNDQSTLLVGRYTDPAFGQVQARAFVHYNLPNDIAVTDSNTNNVTAANRILYDSTRLVLDLNGSWYGDTTAPQEIQVYRLTDSLRTHQNYDISSSVATEAQPLARQSIRPRPTALDSVNGRFTLPDSYGRQLLSLANTDAGKVANSQQFRSQFGAGLMLASTNAATSVLGYQPGGVSQGFVFGSYVVVYYHVAGESRRREQYLLLSGKRFNQITANRAGTPLSALRPGQSLTTTTTGRTYVQPATGVTTKLQFPTLTALLQSGRVAVNRADLTITPLPSENGRLPLPPYMVLTEIDAQYRLVRSDLSSGTVRLFTVQRSGPVSRLPLNYVTPELAFLDPRTNSYTFQVAGYLQSVRAGISPNNGLAILTPSSSLFPQSQNTGALTDQTQLVLTDRVWRMVLEGRASVRLVLFYTRSN